MTDYSPLETTLLWLFLILIVSWPRVFWGRDSKLAIWIPGNRHRLDWQASVFRWVMLALGVALICLGWRLLFSKAAWDIVIVITGSTIVLVFVYVPDLAYYCRQGYQRLGGKNNHKGEDQR